LTLAPEQDAGAVVTAALSKQNVVVAAGHCDPTIEQLDQSLDAGLKLFTHLGNGCPGLMHRHDNIIQRVLSRSERLMISLIADGHHVPTFALGNYLRRIPDENIVIVTDAISAAGLGPGRYELSDQIVEVDPDGAAWAADRRHFAGCATTMKKMVEILKRDVQATDAQITQWTVTNPARLIA
jgi:N-acetylglucosamine-6-phosphate deacetylase